MRALLRLLSARLRTDAPPHELTPDVRQLSAMRAIGVGDILDLAGLPANRRHV